MRDEMIKSIINSEYAQEMGAFEATPTEEEKEKIVNDYIKEKLDQDSYFVFEELLSDYMCQIAERALVVGFKLGVNIMKECFEKA